MSRLSKRWPVFLLTTGCWGISPEMAQYILAGACFVSWVLARLAGALGCSGEASVGRPWSRLVQLGFGDVTQRTL